MRDRQGTAESAAVNNVIVIVKVAIVLMIITLGWQFISPANHTPYLIPANAGKITTGIARAEPCYFEQFKRLTCMRNNNWFVGTVSGCNLIEVTGL